MTQLSPGRGGSVNRRCDIPVGTYASARRAAGSGYNRGMRFDPAVSLRIISNERLRRAGHWGEYRDLGGALALTSEAPVADLNCLESFTANGRQVEALLDVGFSLLRAFDRMPAVRITPLDRPRAIEKYLRTRRLVEAERSVAMVFRGDEAAIHTSREVAVRIAAPDDAREFAGIVAAGGPKWVRQLMLSSTLASLHEPGHTFYLGYIDGEPAGTVHLLREGATAGLYAVATVKAQRRRGLSSTLIARAIADAGVAGCDVIGLRTATNGAARRLFADLGFEVTHEQVLWVAAEPA